MHSWRVQRHFQKIRRIRLFSYRAIVCDGHIYLLFIYYLFIHSKAQYHSIYNLTWGIPLCIQYKVTENINPVGRKSLFLTQIALLHNITTRFNL
jgi:hypothetical protein